VDLANKVSQGLLVLLETEDPLVFLVQQDQLALGVLQGHREKEVTRESLAKKAQQDLKDSLDHLVAQDQEESEERRAQVANLVLLALQGVPETRDLLAWLVLWDLLVAPVFLVHQVKRDLLDLLVLEVNEAMEVLLESLDPLV